MAQAPLSPLEKLLSEQPAPQPISRGVFATSDSAAPSAKATPSKAGEIPAEFKPLITDSAQRYNVPANILAAIASKESEFNPQALGVQTQYGKAKGIMQYLDSTASNLGIDASNPKQSIDAAARQIRERLDKGYSMVDAVREHFAGTDRAKWGAKTAAYGDDVIRRAGQYMDAFGPSTSPEDAPEGGYTAEYAQDLLQRLNKDEPGRYTVATPEQIAAFEAAQAAGAKTGAGPSADFDVNDPASYGLKPQAKPDGALSAIGKSLRNIPGNFQEAAAGQLRSFGEGVDDQTLVMEASKAGVIDRLREDGVITMAPSKNGLISRAVPTLPNGRMADVASLAQYLRENAEQLGLAQANGAAGQANAITELGQRLGKDARDSRLEVNPDGPLAKYSSMIIGSTAEMVPALVAAAVTRSPSVAMGMIGGQVYGQSYERARESKDAPQNPSEAGSYAMAQAVAEAIPSALPIHAILAPGANFFKGLLKAGAAESLQEGVTSALQAGIDKGTIDPNMTWDQAREQIIDGMIVGGGAGVSLRAGTVAARRAREAMRSPERDLGNALNESIDNTDMGSAEQAAVDSLDPNTYAREPIINAETGEVITPVTSQAAPDIKGPLSRADAQAPAPEPMVTEPAFGAVDPAEAFAGQPGQTLDISIPGIEPFRATVDGYADGEVIVIDESGDRFQLTREEMAGAVPVNTQPTAPAQQEASAQAEPPVLTDVVEPGVEIPVLNDVVAPGVEIPTLTDVVETPAAEPSAVPEPTVTPEPEKGKSGAKVVGYKTARGSQYQVHEDGTTTRNKAARNDPGHEGDSGIKPRTEKTIYVDGHAGRLSAAGLQNLGERGARVAIKDGKGYLLTWNKRANKWGVSPQSRDIPIYDEPAVGRSPVELWKQADDVPGFEAYRGMHAGNEITELVTDDFAPAPKQVEQSEPKPLEDQTEAELRESLKYLARQAKSSGGWNKTLIGERRRIEQAIAKASKPETVAGESETEVQKTASDAKEIASDDKKTASDVKETASAAATPGEAVKWFGTRPKADAYLARKKMTGTHKAVRVGGRFEIHPKEGAAAEAAPAEAQGKKDGPHIKRAKVQMGAGEGEAVALRFRNVGYSEPGSAYHIDRIEKNGTVHVTNLATGSKTTWERTDLDRAKFDGASISPDNLTDAQRRAADLYRQSNEAYGKAWNISRNKKGLRMRDNDPMTLAERLQVAELEHESTRLRIESARALGAEPGEILAKNFEADGRKLEELRSRAKAEAQEPAARNQPDRAATGVDSVRGEPIDKNWTAFNEASGTRWVPRSDMPQVRAEHRGALVNFLNARGIKHTEVDIPASQLKATQAEYSPERVQRAKEYDGGQRAILISSDNHVVDGHHQWLAELDMGGNVRAIRLDAPIEQVLEQVKEFPSSTMDKGSESTQQADKPEADFGSEAYWQRLADEQASAENNPQEKPATRPDVQISENKIFTEDAAAKARALLKSKLGQLNSGIDPEIMQAGITLAGYHIEKGARTFAAYAKAMTQDLGDMVRPYLKSWYMGVKYDPRASSFNDMSTAAEVEGFDVSRAITTEEPTSAPSPAERVERDSQQPEAGQPVNAEATADAAGPDVGRAAEPRADAGAERNPGQRDNRVSADGAPAGRERGNQRVHQRDGQFEPSGRAAGSTERNGSGRDRSAGAATQRKRAKQIARTSPAAGTGELAQRVKAQKAASGAPTTWADPTSIDKALPLLLPEQRADVLKAEIRLVSDNKNGILYTNGTGTGKTASGLGIAKRYYNAGKTNIVVVVPTDKIAADWVLFAQMMDMPLKQLDGLNDNGGSGPIITTYANFGQNRTLAKRNWDLVVSDESHYLSSNEDGDTTAALEQLRAITGHHDGMYRWMRDRYAGAYELREKAAEDLAEAGKRNAPEAEIEKLTQAMQEADATIYRLRDRVEPRWQERWQKQDNIGKVAFLSATPFAYHKSVQYAEGYLFDYVPPAELYTRQRESGYNSGDPYQRFMMQHFGYRMRYNKLTAPEAGVQSQVMERQFNNWLQSTGALSGRRLDVPFDYDRKFVTIDDAIGTKIDEALRFLREGEDGKHRKVYDAVMKSFNYQDRMYLLEALKARAAIPIIRSHLDAGRKVVVFHDFNKGGAENPFTAAMRNIGEPEVKEAARAVLSRPMFRFDLRGLGSPIETLTQAFPEAMLFNGTVSKAKRRANADRFNSDDTAPTLFIAQSDAAREGVSLHDTSGKYPRVEINLGMPTRPVAATQIEGRIYRTGQASDAMFRYLTTGTGWEASAFASKIAERASTAENMALGNESRDLRRAFIDAYNNAEEHAITPSDGKGGKASDGALVNLSPYDQAKSFYWANQKNTKRRDSREGSDYYATAEPVGLKKVEWADIRPGESVLEPSAGHGAIARFFPEQSDVTMIEPSYDLSQRAALSNGNAKIINDTFESHHITNKYSAIVMNPPFGSGGKTAIEHLAKAARHLSEGGRIVATIPRGGMADRRLDAFFADPAHANLHTVADIEMPSVAFERAGTGVSTRVLVLERHAGENVPIQPIKIDLSSVGSTKELFDRLENLDLPQRLLEPKDERASLLDGSGVNGNRYDASTLDSSLRTGPLGETLEPLLDTGRVVIHETAPDGVHGLTQGWTDTDGNIHLVADNLTSETAVPVLMHEAFHSGADGLLGTPRWNNLMARLNTFRKGVESGSLKGEWADAYRRTQAAIDAGDGMSQLRAIEELGAYAVENFEKAPPGIRKWAQNVIGMVKEWMARRFGLQVGDITPAQLRAMAVEALRTNSRPAPTAENRYSLADIGTKEPSERAVNSWFSQKMTDAIAGPKSNGQYSILALAPMDRMVEELTDNVGSAKKYLANKREMDAYRNEKHRKFDDIAQEWLKLTVNPKYRKGAEDMAVLMHDATIAQVDPAEPLESRLNPKEREILDKEPGSKRAEEISAELDSLREVHDELAARFNALPERLQQQYRRVRQAYKDMTEELDQIIADNLAAAVDLSARRAERQYNKEIEEIRDDGLQGQERDDAIEKATKKYQTAVTKGKMNKKARLTMLRQKFEANRLRGPYFPLSRFGDYFVTVRDGEGKVLSFSRFENKRDQEKFAARQVGKGKVETGLLSSSSQLRGAVDSRFVADIEEILGKADINDSVRDQVWQRYLESMPDMSLRKGFIHRKNREGYTQDATRAFAHKMFHGAHQMGRLKFGTRMQEALDDAEVEARHSKTPERDTAVVNELVRRHDYVMNPKGGAAAQALTSAAFVYQLSMSPAAALVNMAQTFMVGVPVIGAQYGMAKTTAELAKAGKDFAIGLGHAEKSNALTADEKSAMREAYKSGLIESTQSHNLAGVGDGVGVRYSAVRNKVMGVIAWAFHQAERTNREVTYLAAYRMGRDAGQNHQQAMDSATSLTYKTHFDYGNTNRPRLMHGDTAKVMLVFRNYQVNMLWRLFRDTHQALHGDKEGRSEAVKQLAGMTGMMALNAGVKGVWMYSIAMIIASMLFGDDAEDQFKKATIEHLGPTAAGLLLNGVPGHLTGTALSERIGMPDLWFRSPDRQMEGKEEFNYWQSQLLGFLPSIAQNMFTGYHQAADGNIARGIETAAPKFFKDMMRAYRYGTEGATTLKGDQIVSEFTPGELFAQAMGFTPAVLSEQYARNSQLKNAEQRIMDKRSKLLAKMAVAYRTKDDDLRTETMQNIKEFNQENKRVAITPANIMQSVKARRTRGDRTQGGIYINPKLDKQLRDNIAPAIYR